MFRKNKKWIPWYLVLFVVVKCKFMDFFCEMGVNRDKG